MNRACLLLLGFLFCAAAPAARAQTNQPDNGATAPASAAPAVAPGPAPSLPPPAAPVPVQIFSPGGMTTPPPQIEDIRPPYFFFHPWFWLEIALGLLAAIALIVLLWRWLKPQKWLSPKSAYDLTMEKLVKARTLLSVEDPMPYAVFISETIRSYLSQRFRTPSTRRTTDEFLRLMDNERGTPLAAYRELLRDFLRACDLVKFGRYQPDLEELEQVQQRAFTFVTATRPSPTPDEYNRRPA